MDARPYFFSCGEYNLAQDRAEGFGKWDVGNDAVAKKGAYPSPSAVNKLVRDNQVSGL